MGFIERTIRVRQEEALGLQQEKEEDAKRERKEAQARTELLLQKEGERRLVINYLNESIIPRLLFEYKEKVDLAAEILIGVNYPRYSVGRWPPNEETIEGIVKPSWDSESSSVALELRWDRKGHDYNYIRFVYESNGDIKVDYLRSGKLCLSLRKWRNNLGIQNEVLEKAYKHPNRYTESFNTSDHGTG